MKTEYLSIKLIEQKEKTNVYEISSRLHGFKLGIIKWFPRWRQYSFFPESQTIYSYDCLEYISNFIKKLKEQHA